MGKHRHQQQYRRTVVAAVAIGVIGIPSVAMACTDWPGGGERQNRGGTAPAVDHDRWDGPGRYHQWNGRQHGAPSPVPSDTPAATPGPSKPGKPKPGSAKPSRKPEQTAPGSPASGPTTAPKPTTAAPRPTETAPEPTVAAPKPGTSALKPPTTAPAPTATASPPAASGAVARVVELVNAERGKAGCSPVELNATLSEAARKHSEDMAASGTMSHTGSDGSDPGDRITRAGYAWSTYGENVAHGYSTPEQVMQGWMTSPGHKANILNCAFEEIGVGLAQPGAYWTQDFGTAR
ncbi:CAP domain-containing protein [Streptomyces sp. CHD11]|uniref:CAP domain-containing protein n=1 Tax=Streptomyces sp. CHD11 TaxID=2741325 RepID=UPI001BFCB396|nr:CAP domain-containing protein [Streptomyces sp. CHD11]MBT3153177.1 CAP domain-containing protein [Streptomyces sp. CHD11]